MPFLRRSLLVTSMLLAFTTGIFMTYIIMLNNSFLLDKEFISTIISGAASFLGGVLSGIIAFVVARSQIISQQVKEKERRNTKYINLIKALQNEIDHNVAIFDMLCLPSNIDYKNEYIGLFESNVWENIKYEANNFLPINLYKLLDDQSREYKDIKAGILTEYKDPGKINFKVRQDTIKKISSDLSKIEENIKGAKSKKTLI